MSSVADLTAIARIRDAAVRLFGSQGVERTSVRQIADAAGVSPALVIHHYGSKDALRGACDDWVVEWVARENTEYASARGASAIALIQQAVADGERYRPLLDYLARMLTADGDRSAALFDRFVDETEAMIAAGVADGTMNRSSDPRIQALIITLNGMSTLVMRAHLERNLGGGLLDAAGLARLTLPMLELYTDGLYSNSQMLEVARAALGASAAGGATTTGKANA
ncbi:TetR family transcriptional regulator [Homoserinibacter sp. GY 40078]|uniref:TetR family transcriptional regulator n=1 Tax=Homoserinibacter sp. GY 40078 TaxID=2603275 RepID=UPI0011C7A340|nr:TetR family transcriptional regulator [Homoserinibacter sp. GY 40078]TXK19749.1 TetR/AcrR family transcriptional regulator [Homoserinibacter sp. GY 40078]